MTARHPALTVVLALLLMLNTACRHASTPAEAPITISNNFQDGSQGIWWPRETGWTVQQGALANNAPAWRGPAMMGLPGLSLAEPVLTADVEWQPASAEAWVGLIVGAERPLGSPDTTRGYLLRLRGDRTLALIADGETLASTRLPAATSGTLRLELSAQNGRVEARADGKRVLRVRDRRFAAGEVAVVDAGSSASFGLLAITGRPDHSTSGTEVLARQPLSRARGQLPESPRIRTQALLDQPGTFSAGESAIFTPNGFNYVRFAGEGDAARKVTLNVGHYDGEGADAALAAMQALGATTVRVAAWGGQDATGFTGGAESLGLNGDYMLNFVDFLRRANRHGLRVVAVFEGVPRNAYYDSIARIGAGPQPGALITGANDEYLSKAAIAAKRAAIFDFLHYVKESDPALLTTVLGWELSSEAHARGDQGPFAYPERKVTTANGNEYDMSTPQGRQACWDEGIVFWANELTNAVRAVDPQALVGVGMWTADAQRRAPASGLPIDAQDSRFPPRPSVLARADCAIDFLDFHLYDADGLGSLYAAGHEWLEVARGGKPVLVGETGVPRRRHTPESALAVQSTILQQTKLLGYQGALLWTWDLTQGPGSETYSAQDEGMADLWRQWFASTPGIVAPQAAPAAAEQPLPENMEPIPQAEQEAAPVNTPAPAAVPTPAPAPTPLP